MLLVDYSQVEPAELQPRNGDGSPEAVALDEFDLAYSLLVDAVYAAFGNGGLIQSEPPLTGLQIAVHAMYALKNKAVALMRTPKPERPGRTLCPRFTYVALGGDRDKLIRHVEERSGSR